MTTILTAALLGVGVGCAAGSGAPQIVLDRTACARCGMLVSDLAGAAAYRAASGEVRVYDDLRCLIDDRAEGVGRDVPQTSIWVHEHGSGAPLPASDATFVRSAMLRTPMGGGLAVFADAAAAAAFAKTSGGAVLHWHSLEAETVMLTTLEDAR